MSQWNAKIHKSGTKVAIFNGSKLVKVVEASKETYEPAEAQKFAEALLTELKSRSAAQMTDPAQQPTVVSESELQNSSMSAVTQQAEGKGAGEEKSDPIEKAMEEKADPAPVAAPAPEVEEEKIANQSEELRRVIAGLKKKLSQERSERTVERKARRGLAIAKQMVAEGTLENSYDTIKAKVSQIMGLEDAEIARLERKMAGEQEFESIDEASREVRRQARIARINRQAAAEAQEDGDERHADFLDKRADEAEAKMAHIEQIIETMKKASEETPVAPKVEEEKADAPAAPEVKEEEKADAPAATPAPEVKEEKADAPAAPETKEEECCKASNESEDKIASMARKYRSIAANHRKLAEEAESKGDIEAADKQDELADEAEEKAEEIEKKLAKEEAPAATETPAEEAKEESEEKADEAVAPAPVEDEKKETVEANKKQAAKQNPGQTVSAPDYNPLQRDGQIVEEFGIDKNASLVEQNDYANDPEVEILSKMWRGAPQDE